MKTLLIASFLILSSVKYPVTKDGIIYWVDNAEKDAIISVFGMRRNSEFEVGKVLLKMYNDNDTISRKMSIQTNKGIIYGCYYYEDTGKQYLLNFCAEKYVWLDGEITEVEKSKWCDCN